MNPYRHGLEPQRANHAALSPLSFFQRAATVFANHLAIVDDARRLTWGEVDQRCRRLAAALMQRGVGPQDTVSVMLLNSAEMLEVHFAVPMTGAVLHCINTRLDAASIAYQLQHAETKVLITDCELSLTISEVLPRLAIKPLVVDVFAPGQTSGESLGEIDYEGLLRQGAPEFRGSLPDDEWSAISLNYTSGTTGDPKGVVYSHRGAYLQAVGNVLAWELPRHPIYLWTLPMFHCNGWCFPWSLAAVAGTNVCLRKVDVAVIYQLMAREGVTHYCGAPLVHRMIAEGAATHGTANPGAALGRQVKGMVAAAPPPVAVLQTMAENGFEITHVYGLTESYGPSVICEWHPDWNTLPLAEQAQLKARQGVACPMLEQLMVADPTTLVPVPADGQTMGEVMLRGNLVMMGYLKDAAATAQAFQGGWFRTGDLGVMHPDGFLEVRDRSKDIIISGGENISTIEVENAICRHPAVQDVAVVAQPDDRWGETPCAFVTLKSGERVTAAELIEFCRRQLAHFKVPRTIIFGPLPKTSTGKTQKYVLREQARQLAADSQPRERSPE